MSTSSVYESNLVGFRFLRDSVVFTGEDGSEYLFNKECDNFRYTPLPASKAGCFKMTKYMQECSLEKDSDGLYSSSMSFHFRYEDGCIFHISFIGSTPVRFGGVVSVKRIGDEL